MQRVCTCVTWNVSLLVCATKRTLKEHTYHIQSSTHYARLQLQLKKARSSLCLGLTQKKKDIKCFEMSCQLQTDKQDSRHNFLGSGCWLTANWSCSVPLDMLKPCLGPVRSPLVHRAHRRLEVSTQELWWDSSQKSLDFSCRNCIFHSVPPVTGVTHHLKPFFFSCQKSLTILTPINKSNALTNKGKRWYLWLLLASNKPVYRLILSFLHTICTLHFTLIVHVSVRYFADVYLCV